MKINEIKNSELDYDIGEIAYWTSKGIEIEGKTYPIEKFSIKETGLFATIALGNDQFSDYLIAGNAGYDGGHTEAELATKAKQTDLLITNQNVSLAQTTANQAETDAQNAITMATEAITTKANQIDLDILKTDVTSQDLAISTNSNRLLSVENRLAELEKSRSYVSENILTKVKKNGEFND